MSEILQDPPLVDVKVTNPVTYFKNWWKKIIGNEGVDFRFHIKPLTFFIMVAIIASVAFGTGVNISSTTNEKSPTPKPTGESQWRQTAYTGTLHFSDTTQNFYLTTTSASEAITLLVPENLDLTTLVGKRIFAIGDYSKTERLLKITDAKDLEVLPKTPVPIPTIEPTNTPNPLSIESPSPVTY